MPNQLKVVPKSLLQELGLIDGVFESRTVIVGRPNAHNTAVLNEGEGPPATIRIDLTLRADWPEIDKKLRDEGF